MRMPRYLRRVLVCAGRRQILEFVLACSVGCKGHPSVHASVAVSECLSVHTCGVCRGNKVWFCKRLISPVHSRSSFGYVPSRMTFLLWYLSSAVHSSVKCTRSCEGIGTAAAPLSFSLRSTRAAPQMRLILHIHLRQLSTSPAPALL